jgi:Flp pilus assembly protein protease CpaA
MSFFISGLLFLGLALITGGIGGGDVKLIAPLGLIFGIIPTLYLICYSFIVAGAVSIILMITKKAKMGTEIALAPYIGIATIIIIIGPLSQAL